MGREEELEEEGGEIERDADSWVESTEGESEEGGRAKDTLEGRSDGDTAREADETPNGPYRPR